jgi:pepF/M3 family oligoendopeptidase
MTTKTQAPPAPTWDLESIFPGGSESKQFAEYRSKVKGEVSELETALDNLPRTLSPDTLNDWTGFLLAMQSCVENIELILAFAGCLAAQNTDDSKAFAFRSEGYELYSRWQKVETALEAMSLKQSDSAWKQLVEHDRLKEVAYYLNELREIAKSKMPIEQEKLALDLAVNGYHAWDLLYTKMAGELKADFEEDGQVRKLSMGQLATKMSSADRSIRRQAFEKLLGAWEARKELAAMALNSQAGFRLSLYKHRGWGSILKEPLRLNRLSQQSLEAMWSVVERETPRLKPYIEAKKKLLGIESFRWYDEFAAVGDVERTFAFDEAGQFVADNVGRFSADMGSFVRMAIERRWVEAEDRGGKAGGAFCTSLGPLRQSRVFMTFAGSFENLLTLAHELGHAYHGWVLRDRAYFAGEYPMGLAETASIFSETVVTDAALEQASGDQEKLMLLEQKLQAAYVMFTDLYSRYLFDRAFYDERADGVVGSDRLTELMLAAQKRAFQGMLSEDGYHPLFWCSKLHFYHTSVPFYNFPYTFGFLFAGGVYHRARQEGASFADKYAALLADTGSMSTEDVAKKHLGVDLTKEDFWKDAVDQALADVDAFVALASK